MSGKRIFILIDKTDSEFLDRIIAAIKEGRRKDRNPGSLLFADGSQTHPRRPKEYKEAINGKARN